MASSGKKGKKTKGKTLALNDFLQETPGITPTIPIRKSTINWADEVEDNYDQYESRQKANVVLPTAPKSARGFDEFNERIPQHPPYNAYITNLPYDVREDEIVEFFGDLKISNMRIPREDRTGEPQRLKGYGYIEFEDRDSLIGALSITDCTLKNRRIRIEVADNLDNDRKRGGRMDNNRDRPDRSEVTSGDWRLGPRVDPPEMSRNRPSGFSRDRDSGLNDKEKGGSWRDNRDRSNLKDIDRGRDGFGDRNRFNDKDGERRGFGPRRGDDRDFSRGFGRDDSGPDKSEPRTRPTIVLQQRTLPLNTDSVQNGSQDTNSVPASSSIFGNAKPVDTSIRERQIEELLAKQSERTASEREKRRDDRRDWGKRDSDSTWSRDRRKESPRRDSPIRRGSPAFRNDHSPNPSRNYDQRTDSLGRRYSPEGRKRSPEFKRESPERYRRSPERQRRSPDRPGRSPERLRKSPERPRRSPERSRRSPDYKANSPIRRTSPEFSRNSLDRSRYSPDYRGASPERKGSSIIRRRSPRNSPEPRRRSSPEQRRRVSPEPRRRNSPEPRRRSSPEPRRRSSPEPRRRSSPEPRKRSSPEPRRRTSPEQRRRGSPEPISRRDSPDQKRRSPDRPQPSRSNQRKPDDRDKKGVPKNERTQKNDRDKKKEEKPSRDNHEREMPKMREPEAPNFAVSNKYAFLPEED